MTQVIGITGRKGHGKDAVARELVLKGFTVARFAGPLKAMLAAFYEAHDITPSVIARKIEGDLKEHPCPLLRGKTPRYAMQTLGDEWGRQLIAADLWTESLVYRVEGIDKLVVPDLRHHNESDALDRLGAVKWRIDASKRVPCNEFSDHASETSVDHLPVDKEIDNNGTLFELQCAVGAALEPA